MIRRPARSFLRVGLITALLALPLAAQEHPNTDRGFTAERSFLAGDVDNVNLFNGNLVLTIPLGITYPVGGGLSYGLTLAYNSNVWDFQEVADPDHFGNVLTQALPNRRSNAGFGWLLTLGSLYASDSPGNDTGRWVYSGPDGADHAFYETLHAGDPDDPGDSATSQSVLYTRDGSYLRLKVGADRQVEFPDSRIAVFDAAQRLVQIKDRYTNHIDIAYDTGLWTISDSQGRTQKIYFQTLMQNNRQVEMVDRVELSTFRGGAPAVYDLVYTPKTINRGCPNASSLGTQVLVQLLTSLVLPDGSRYQMPESDYITDAPTPAHDCRTSGAIQALTLPTLGRLEWTYQRYLFPPDSGKAFRTFSAGVATRAVRTPGVSTPDVWTYATSVTPPPSGSTHSDELVNTVTDPLGHRTVRYFSVSTLNALTGWSVFDYSLPFTRNVTDGAGRSLSAQVFSAGVGTPLRSTYVRYERDEAANYSDLADKMNLNRRQTSSRVAYEDDNTWADVNSSDFDGLGHYRQTQTNGSFGSGDVRTMSVAYNTGNGTYQLNAAGAAAPGFTMKPTTDPWALDVYSERSVTEGSWTEREIDCVDTNNGFLFRRRILRDPSQVRADDLMMGRGRDTMGNLIAEAFFGGDGANLSTTNLCFFPAPAPTYRVRHTYQSGALATSIYDNVTFYSVNRTIDASTGLPWKSTDTAGLTTTFDYDAMGRLTWEQPAAGHGGWTEYVYSPAVSASDLADVLIRRRANGSTTAAVLAQSQILFDAQGRVWKERRLLPDGTWSVRETLYDAAGNKKSISEAQATENPTKKTQFSGYDPFGRPTAITPSDGAAHSVSLSYSGVRSLSRTVKIGTMYNATTGAVTESSATTTEIYDRQGRLWKVTEPSGSGGANVTTTYAYDASDRLRQATTTSGVTQTRSWSYDRLGFLRSETHPEKGTFGNGTITYSGYDARGHFTRKIDGPNDLTYTYDTAERITGIAETGGRLLKAFAYDTCSGANDWCGGKRVTAQRYNYPVLGTTPHTALITETYTYGGREGRVSKRDTSLTFDGGAAESFTQSFTYYHLGQEKTVAYPQCTHSGCSATAAQPRTVTNNFSEGLLSSVVSGATTYGTLTYHPNLLVNQITHANGIVETQANDPKQQTYTFDPFGNITAIGGTSGRSTPTSATTNRLNGTGTAYDAAGNLTSWNGATYQYDAFNQMKRMVSGAEEWLYNYTADDERIWSFKVGGNFSRWTLRDVGGKVLREYTNSAGVWAAAEDYLYRDGLLLAAELSGGQRRHFHLDHLGTPRLITNQNGAQVAYHAYYPFGEEATAFNQDAERAKFTGHERDLASAAGAGDDLDYMHARFFALVAARFTSTDLREGDLPVPQSLNRYSYTTGNPLRFVDPNGQVSVDTISGYFNALASDFLFGVFQRNLANTDYQEGQRLGHEAAKKAGATLTALGAGAVGGGLVAEGPSAGTSTVAVLGGVVIASYGVVVTKTAAGAQMSAESTREGSASNSAGNIKTASDKQLKQLGIDAEKLKNDFVPNRGSKFNIAVDKNGDMYLVPVKKAQGVTIETGMNLGQAQQLYPRK